MRIKHKMNFISNFKMKFIFSFTVVNIMYLVIFDLQTPTSLEARKLRRVELLYMASTIRLCYLDLLSFLMFVSHGISVSLVTPA